MEAQFGSAAVSLESEGRDMPRSEAEADESETFGRTSESENNGRTLGEGREASAVELRTSLFHGPERVESAHPARSRPPSHRGQLGLVEDSLGNGFEIAVPLHLLDIDPQPGARGGADRHAAGMRDPDREPKRSLGLPLGVAEPRPP